MARAIDSDTTEEETSAVSNIKASIRNKTNPGGPRLVLMEESEADSLNEEQVPHSGTVVNGINRYDESPVRGGRILTQKGLLINHRGHEIEPDGTVINPEQYRTDTDFNG